MVERYFIRSAKCEACIQHDKRGDNDRSLTDTDGDTTVQNPARFHPVSNSYQHLVIFHDAIFSQTRSR
jgi:hypothetical protein